VSVELDALLTPAAIVDLDRMEANLDRMAAYAASHGLALRPHVKTHKSPHLAAEQLRRGASGLTVAQLNEARIMADVSDDMLLAHPPVGAPKLERLLALPDHVRLRVALDSVEALDAVAAAAAGAGRQVGVLVELDLGMGRVGLGTSAETVRLCRRARRSTALRGRA
jgi:D-serine deaminase-like pyridoxal phosphate-dependent protein